LFFFLQRLQIARVTAHLHPALIIIITKFRACWEHHTGYRESQVFLIIYEYIYEYYLWIFPWKHNRYELQSSND